MMMRAGAGGKAVVIVLGRANKKLGCPALDGAIRAFAQCGVQIVRYESPYEQASAAIDAGIAAGPFASWMPLPSSERLAAKVMRTALRLMLCWGAAGATEYLLGRLVGVRRLNRWRLSRFVRQYGVGQVIVLAHSAGGVLGASIAGEPAISRLIGFGYPFRHPQRGDEAYRTRHLATLAKPFLIIQGDRDDYGDADAARRYRLSPHITLWRVDADHGYDLGQGADFAELIQVINGFALGNAATGGSEVYG